jgi:DNA primase
MMIHDQAVLVQTRNGISLHLLRDEQVLADPRDSGLYVRAFCPIHGGDHQRSLSIHRETGWGRCFTCQARVLMEPWNPEIAERLRTRAEGRVIALSPRRHASPHTQARAPVSLPSMWQQEEVALLDECSPHLHRVLAAGSSRALRRARAYLLARGIAPELAASMGICYLPPDLPLPQSFQRWRDRILFPLSQPGKRGGYIGRTLCGWQPGMSEQEHQQILDRPLMPRRWLKTSPAGWFGPAPEELDSCIVLVEGGFDRLALLAAGLDPDEVVALVGTSVNPSWLPAQVQHVILAFDGDQSGWKAMQALARTLRQREKRVHLCPPPSDDLGKDWNERWQRALHQGVVMVLEASRSSSRSLPLRPRRDAA